MSVNVKGQGHWERKCKNRFSRIYSSTVIRFMSNKERNLHISSKTFHRRKCFVFCICL